MRVPERCYEVTGLGYSSPWCVNAGFVVGDEMTLVVDTGASLLSGQTVHRYASAVRPGNGFSRGQGIDVWGHAGIARTAQELRRR